MNRWEEEEDSPNSAINVLSELLLFSENTSLCVGVSVMINHLEFKNYG